MDIEITFGERDPPTGLVRVAESEPVPFSGWLGLLKVLSEVVDPPSGGPHQA